MSSSTDKLMRSCCVKRMIVLVGLGIKDVCNGMPGFNRFDKLA